MEGLGRQAKFDKLFAVSMLVLGPCIWHHPDLLLLHQLLIGAIINNIFAKHWGCKLCIDLFSVDIFEFCIEDELVAFRAQVDCCFLAQEDKSEHVAILTPGLAHCHDLGRLGATEILTFF